MGCCDLNLRNQPPPSPGHQGRLEPMGPPAGALAGHGKAGQLQGSVPLTGTPTYYCLKPTQAACGRSSSQRCFICISVFLNTSITYFGLPKWLTGKEKVKCWSLSRVRLFATPWTVAHQAPLFTGFSRQECCGWLPFPSPGESSQRRDRIWVCCIAGQFFTI